MSLLLQSLVLHFTTSRGFPSLKLLRLLTDTFFIRQHQYTAKNKINITYKLAFLPLPWPLKYRIERGRMTHYFKKNLFVGLLVQWRISFTRSISKNPQKGVEEPVNLISFRCQLKWGERFAFSFAQLSLQVQPQERLGYYSNPPIGNDVPNYLSMCHWNTRNTLCSHTGKHQQKDVCMNKYSSSQFSLLVSYKFSCNKLCYLTVKMQSVFSQSGGKLMLWHPIHADFRKAYKGYVWRDTEQLSTVNTMLRNNTTWNTDCSIKVFRVFLWNTVLRFLE